MEFDRPKFKRLVHYIIWKAGKRDWFGATKLNKVLWFVDARAYMLTGKPITGETYIREKFGPVPKHIKPVLNELQRERTVKITKEGKLTRIVTEQRADRNWFTHDELLSIDWWIDHIDRDHTAGTISEETHDHAWEIAEMGEELPLYAYRVARIPDQTSPEDLEWLKSHAKELGLL